MASAPQSLVWKAYLKAQSVYSARSSIKNILHQSLAPIKEVPIAIRVVERQYVVNSIIHVEYYVSVFGRDMNGVHHCFPNMKTMTVLKRGDDIILTLNLHTEVPNHPVGTKFFAMIYITITQENFPVYTVVSARFESDSESVGQTHFI